MKIFHFYLLCFLTIIFVNNLNAFAQTSEALNSKFYFEENLSIGDDQNPEHLEYLLGSPDLLVTNSKGDIYIADNKYGAIKIFNSEGIYQNNIGSNGRGPGEFMLISAMSILPNDDLLVYDYTLFRATIFDSYGKVKSIIQPKLGPNLNPNKLATFSQDKIVVMQRKFGATRGLISVKDDNLIHIYNSDFSRQLDEFVNVQEMIDINEPFELRFAVGYNNSFSMTDSTLTVAPYFYRGEIYTYAKKGSSWEIEDTLRNYVKSKKPFKPNNDIQFIRDLVMGKIKNYTGGAGIVGSTPNGPISGIMINESLGVFRYNNNKLLHLAFLTIDGKCELYATQFNAAGDVEAQGRVVNLNPGMQPNGYFHTMNFFETDEKNQIYFINYAEEGFTVKRGFIKMRP